MNHFLRGFADELIKVADGAGLLHGQARKAPTEHRKLIASPGAGPAKRLDEFVQTPMARKLNERVMQRRAQPMYPIPGIDTPKKKRKAVAVAANR